MVTKRSLHKVAAQNHYKRALPTVVAKNRRNPARKTIQLINVNFAKTLTSQRD
jgi:hypothetical protein